MPTFFPLYSLFVQSSFFHHCHPNSQQFINKLHTINNTVSIYNNTNSIINHAGSISIKRPISPFPVSLLDWLSISCDWSIPVNNKRNW